MVKSLIARLFSNRPATEPLRFVVYSREGCGCCRKALAVLGEFQSRHRFVVEEVDVDASPDVRARYGGDVPVVEVGGRVRFRGSINPAMLERLLKAEASAGEAG
ncbi:glutaredoxin family protein [Paludisphaera mucosa]|uniref:Glutaredoxin family protein n=1 Tax=Paludisphaera mucosa TaxID=3030827 RepID=A0ABT6F6L3_9BACT|nr:glutaredoxin family protein [Paludisphaera mucosa]MDG3003222.1 glutaredoxin family protein [Paludisphaera mucosa]